MQPRLDTAADQPHTESTMFLNLNFAEWLALRNGAVRMSFNADQTQINSRVFAPLFDRFTDRFTDRFFDDGALPGVPMN